MLDINRLLNALDLADLVRQAGGKLANGRQSCACPLHDGDNTAAFHLWKADDGREMWTCFTKCGTGNALSFIKRWQNVEGAELMRRAADYAHLSLEEIGLTEAEVREHQARELRRDVLDLAAQFYQQQFRHGPKPRAALAYAAKRAFGFRALMRFGFSDSGHGLSAFLKERGADMKLALEMGLIRKDGTDFTAAAKGRAASPAGYLIYIHRVGGRAEYLSARAITPAADMPDAKDKSRNLPSDREKFPQALARQIYRAEARGDSRLVIVEGQADAESLRQLGRSAWALCGTALTDDDVAAAGKRSAVYLALDDDTQRPGTDEEKAARRQRQGKRTAELAGRLGPLTYVGVPLAGKDFNDWLQAGATPEAVENALSLARPWIDVRLDQAETATAVEFDGLARDVAELIARLPTASQKKYFRSASSVLGLSAPELRDLMNVQQANRANYSPSTIKAGRITFMNEALANFEAHIVGELTVEDGFTDGLIRYAIEGRLATGEPLQRLDVLSTEYESMEWVARWGVRVISFVANGRKNLLARAIKEVSVGNGLKREKVYTFTGWTGDGAARGYLSASGKLHAGGLDGETKVDLGADKLKHYHLPEPPTGEAALKAVYASLHFLEAAPLNVTAVLWAAMYAAPLTSVRPLNAVVWPYGPTQSGKSTVSHLALAHYGAGFIGVRDFHAPMDWTSTVTAIEGGLFMVKDMPFIIDDYAPQFTSEAEARELRKKAALVIRSVGNRSGKGRSSGDLTARKERPPRGLVIGTSENPLVGQSLVGRMIYVTVARGDVLKPNGNPELDRAQQNARAGLYAQAMSVYLQWLARNWERAVADLSAQIDASVAEARAKFPGDQSRLPDYFAILDACQRMALGAFVELGIVARGEAAQLVADNSAAIMDVVLGQAAKIAAESPAQMFFRALDSLLSSGEVYLTASKYDANFHRPERAKSIGWYNPDKDKRGLVYLDLEAALAQAMKFYAALGQHLDAPPDAMRRHIHQAGVLHRQDKIAFEVSVYLEGRNRRALEIDNEKLKAIYDADLYPVLDKDAEEPTDQPSAVMQARFSQ